MNHTVAERKIDAAGGRSSTAHSLCTFFGILGIVVMLGVLAGRSAPVSDREAVAAAPIDEPRFEIMPKAIDFGDVQYGTTATTAMKIVNRGSHPLTVAGITTTCGCTVAEKPTTPIPAGESVEVQVRMSVGSRIGQLTARHLSVRIDGLEESIRIPVQARSAELIRVSPATIDPGTATGAEPVPELLIESMDGRRFSIASVEPPVFTFSRTESRSRHELHFQSSSWARANSPRTVTIRTRHPEVPVLTVRINGSSAAVQPRAVVQKKPASDSPTVDPPMQIFPQRLSFGDIDPVTRSSDVRELFVPGVEVFERKEVEALTEHRGISVEIMDIQQARGGISISARLLMTEEFRRVSGLAGPEELRIQLGVNGRHGWFIAYVSVGITASP